MVSLNVHFPPYVRFAHLLEWLICSVRYFFYFSRNILILIFWFLKFVLSFISYGRLKTFWENKFFKILPKNCNNSSITPVSQHPSPNRFSNILKMLVLTASHYSSGLFWSWNQMPLKMKCNSDPLMNYFRINYWGWRLNCFTQNSGAAGGKKWENSALRCIISPRGSFFAILTLYNSKHSLHSNIRKTTCPEG